MYKHVNKLTQILFRRLKIKETIVVDSFFGNSIDENCFEIAVALSRYQAVVFVTNATIKNHEFPANIKVVRYGSFRHLYHLCTSRLLINNSRYNDILIKRKEQIYIQIWHGIPYKRLVFDQPAVNFIECRSKYHYLAGFLLEVEKWDYLFAQNAYTAQCFESCFLFDGKIKIADYESDISIVKGIDAKKKLGVLRKLCIPEGKKIVLYAPTFREFNEDENGNYALSAILPKTFFKKHSDICFLFRAHYLIEKNLALDDVENVINVTNYLEISDLYQISDLLISDYSSVIFEFARTQKPIILYQEDREEYQNKRGLYDISLENYGVQLYEKWDQISFDFMQKTKLTDDLALVGHSLVDEIVRISHQTVTSRRKL